MARRRNNGEGTIVRLPSGSFRVQLRSQGKRFSKTAPTKRECQQWLEAKRRELSKGFDLSASSVSFASFLDSWLNTVSSSRKITTHSTYVETVKPAIKRLGNISIGEINPYLVQSLFQSRLDAGCSAHSVRSLYKVLHVAFEFAVKQRMLSYNPVSATTPPRPVHKEMSFYDENEVQTFLLTAQAMDEWKYALYYLAIYTGMRQGELLGLQWEDLDKGEKTITVSRQLTYVTGQGFSFTEPKSAKGTRSVLLGKQALRVLHHHYQVLDRHRNRKGDAWQKNNLIFPSWVGTPTQSSNLRRSMKRVIKAANLPHVRFHALRHTNATLLLNAGFPLHKVAHRLGHSKPSITMDIYGHYMPSQQKEVVDYIDDLLTPVEIPLNGTRMAHESQKNA